MFGRHKRSTGSPIFSESRRWSISCMLGIYGLAILVSVTESQFLDSSDDNAAYCAAVPSFFSSPDCLDTCGRFEFCKLTSDARCYICVPALSRLSGSSVGFDGPAGESGPNSLGYNGQIDFGSQSNIYVFPRVESNEVFSGNNKPSSNAVAENKQTVEPKTEPKAQTTVSPVATTTTAPKASAPVVRATGPRRVSPAPSRPGPEPAGAEPAGGPVPPSPASPDSENQVPVQRRDPAILVPDDPQTSTRIPEPAPTRTPQPTAASSPVSAPPQSSSVDEMPEEGQPAGTPPDTLEGVPDHTFPPAAPVSDGASSMPPDSVPQSEGPSPLLQMQVDQQDTATPIPNALHPQPKNNGRQNGQAATTAPSNGLHPNPQNRPPTRPAQLPNNAVTNSAPPVQQNHQQLPSQAAFTTAIPPRPSQGPPSQAVPTAHGRLPVPNEPGTSAQPQPRPQNTPQPVPVEGSFSQPDNRQPQPRPVVQPSHSPAQDVRNAQPLVQSGAPQPPPTANGQGQEIAPPPPAENWASSPPILLPPEIPELPGAPKNGKKLMQIFINYSWRPKASGQPQQQPKQTVSSVAQPAHRNT